MYFVSASEITIPTELFVALMAILSTGIITFLAWMVKNMTEMSKQLATTTSQLIDLRAQQAEHHERLTWLERAGRPRPSPNE